MAMARWTPFQEFPTLRDAMDRLFEQSVVRPNGWHGQGWHAALPLDVYADGDNFVIEAALPGLDPDTVNVSVLGNQVTISGEYPAAPEGRQYLFRERGTGHFERSIYLPTDLDAEKTEAHYEHGMLRLTLPKAESAKPRRISLTAGQ
ncbi:MAG TPA: Hsp20/alpha crystallin family protein [Chloroflexota bacterium]|jgi:HSP20 family protein